MKKGDRLLCISTEVNSIEMGKKYIFESFADGDDEYIHLKEFGNSTYFSIDLFTQLTDETVNFLGMKEDVLYNCADGIQYILKDGQVLKAFVRGGKFEPHDLLNMKTELYANENPTLNIGTFSFELVLGNDNLLIYAGNHTREVKNNHLKDLCKMLFENLPPEYFMDKKDVA